MQLDLPSRTIAVALASIGAKPLVPKWNRNDATGAMVVTWSLKGAEASACQTLIASVGNPDPKKDLLRKSPEDPYLVCLYYQENRQALQKWLSTGTRPLVLKSGPKSRLLRVLDDSPALREHHLGPLFWQPGTAAAGAISDPFIAAIAVLCGFVPRPELDTSTRTPRFVFTAESMTFPGLRLSDLQRATHESAIGSYPAGAHPACYALVCAVNLVDFIEAEKIAARNPTHQFKGKGTKSALMSENLLTADSPKFYRDALRSHLATS